MFTTLMVAFLPTIISFSLTYMQETQFKATIFKIINLMSDGFNATEVISTIITMFSTLIAFQNLEIDIPDPTDVYRHCFLQEGNLSNLERIKRLNFLQGLISLKIIVTLPSRFYDRKMSYEVFLLKKVDEESISVENYVILRNKDPKMILERIEAWIECLVVEGGRSEKSYQIFKKDWKQFLSKLNYFDRILSISKLGYFDKIFPKILLRAAFASVIVSFFSSFTNFDKMDGEQILKAIPFPNVVTLWIMLNFSYIGHCLRNIFELGHYFFNVIEKIELKKYFEEKQRLALQEYSANSYEWLNM